MCGHREQLYQQQLTCIEQLLRSWSTTAVEPLSQFFLSPDKSNSKPEVHQMDKVHATLYTTNITGKIQTWHLTVC